MQQTERPAAEGAKLRGSAAPYNIFAEFPDMPSARRAVEALGNAGIEGDNISVTGKAADNAAAPESAEETLAKTREMDAQFGKHMLRLIGYWTVAGVIGGALLGIPLSIGIMAVLGADITLERVIAGVFLTALAAGIIAWLFPHTSVGKQAAPPWELTFAESVDGPVKVGVHSDNADEVERAEGTLRKHQPLRVYRAGPDGTPR
jgi:hypothetical protein